MTATNTQATPVITGEVFDPHSAEHVRALIRMHQDYLLEELARTGEHALGVPAAGWLRTMVLRAGGDFAGYFAADMGRHSVELIYVVPEFRGHGLSTQVLAELAAKCPQPMSVKAPLTPGGQRLADKLGLHIAYSTPEELQETSQTLAELRRGVDQHCTHKRTGDPRRPCMRCYRAAVKKSATATVMAYVALAHAADAMRGGRR
jgi:GNAT superfamily N-acetyltransferase